MRDADLTRRGIFGELQTDLRSVGRRLAVGRVVHLQLDHAAGLEPNRRPGPEDLRIRPGRVSRQNAARCLVLALRPRACALPRLFRHHHLLPVGTQHGCALHVGLGPIERQRVVHDLSVAGSQLDRLNPLRLGEVGRDVEVLVLDHPVGRDLVLLFHFEHHVRLPDGPALGIDRSRRQILGIAPLRTGVRPLDQDLLLVVAQAALVEERALRRRGVPGRHVTFADFVTNVLGMRPDVVIRQERHRRDLARTMAGRAVAKEDWGDVLRVGGGCRRGLGRGQAEAAHRKGSHACKKPTGRVHRVPLKN